MTQEQKKLFDLYKEIHDICLKHDIVYYMAGGTLIGAMRHHGFIPWDDDLDIMMTRDEWLRFLKVIKTEMPEGRALECQEFSRDYTNMFGRYMDVNASAIHKNQILGDGIAGYVIDILVLDPIPDQEAHQKYIEDLMLYSDLINPFSNYSYRYGINKKRYKIYEKRIRKEGKDAVLRELEQHMFSYAEAECDYYALRWGGVSFLFEKKLYGSKRYGIFEGVTCRIPDRSGDYLTQHYGDDWMYIPPHGEHESHDAIFSLTTDYKTIQNDYMRYLDIEKTRKAFINKKRFFFKHMEKRLQESNEKIAIQALATKYEFEQKLSQYQGDIQQNLEQCEYESLNDLFDAYLKKQLSREYIGREDFAGIYRFNHPQFVEIDDKVLYVAVMLLIHTNRMAKAERLLNVRKQCKGKLPNELLNAYEVINNIRDAISDYDIKEYDCSFEKTKELYQAFPNNESLNMFYIRQLLERKKTVEAQMVLTRAKSLFPNNGVFDKYMGDCMRNEDVEQAFVWYERALKHTTNGYTIMEIETLRADYGRS